MPQPINDQNLFADNRPEITELICRFFEALDIFDNENTASLTPTTIKAKNFSTNSKEQLTLTNGAKLAIEKLILCQ